MINGQSSTRGVGAELSHWLEVSMLEPRGREEQTMNIQRSNEHHCLSVLWAGLINENPVVMIISFCVSRDLNLKFSHVPLYTFLILLLFCCIILPSLYNSAPPHTLQTPQSMAASRLRTTVVLCGWWWVMRINGWPPSSRSSRDSVAHRLVIPAATEFLSFSHRTVETSQA